MLNSFKLIDEHRLATILMQLWGTGLYANRYSQPAADINLCRQERYVKTSICTIPGLSYYSNNFSIQVSNNVHVACVGSQITEKPAKGYGGLDAYRKTIMSA